MVPLVNPLVQILMVQQPKITFSYVWVSPFINYLSHYTCVHGKTESHGI